MSDIEIRVKVTDVATGEVLAVSAALDECLPLPENARTFYAAVAGLQYPGHTYFVGGGAAPLIKLERL